jgi:hypothetical protein
MAKRLPTMIGDVLILRTANSSYGTHAVGLVSKNGQQDFEHQRDVKYTTEALPSTSARACRRVADSPTSQGSVQPPPSPWGELERAQRRPDS